MKNKAVLHIHSIVQRANIGHHKMKMTMKANKKKYFIVILFLGLIISGFLPA